MDKRHRSPAFTTSYMSHNLALPKVGDMALCYATLLLIFVKMRNA